MKTVLITGAAGNLGSAMTGVFSENNYRVLGIYHRKEPEAVENARYLRADLFNEAEATAAIQQAIIYLEKIDVAVLTVGGFTMDSIDNASTEDIRQMIALNFDTAYHVAKPLFKHMLGNKKGTIFLTGSRQGRQPALGAKALSYTLSKRLLFTLAEILNEQAKDSGVRIEVIVPTTIDTPENRQSMPAADTSSWQKPADLARDVLQMLEK